MTTSQGDSSPGRRLQPSEATLQAILEALDGMRFGQVTIIVQDGHVIQIDRVEKRRLKEN